MKGLFIVMLLVVVAKYSCGLEVIPAGKAECDCSEFIWETDCPCLQIENYYPIQKSKSR